MKFIALTAVLALLSVPAHAEPKLNRVNATQTLKCGYVAYDPAMVKDEATGEWKGMDVEVTKAVAHRLGLQVEYAAETGWASVVTDLNAGKFDALCSSFWVHPDVAKFALFARPYYYQPVFVIARADDERFAKGIPNLDDPALKMSAIDGDNPVAIAAADFPKAQVVALPNMTNFSQVLLELADKKVDFTITDAVSFGTYNKSNPGRLKIVDVNKPARVYPAGYVVGSEDYQLRDALNAALNELILDGTIDRIMDKYDVYPNAYYRAVEAFRNPYKKE